MELLFDVILLIFLWQSMSRKLKKQAGAELDQAQSWLTDVLNSKSEWHQPALFSVRSEIVRCDMNCVLLELICDKISPAMSTVYEPYCYNDLIWCSSNRVKVSIPLIFLFKISVQAILVQFKIRPAGTCQTITKIYKLK